MAKFRDSNGTIVIDEAEANNDIKRIGAAMEAMEAGRKRIGADTFWTRYNIDGESVRAAVSAVEALNGECIELMERMEAAQKAIRSAVEKYKAIDKRLEQQARGM